jgi:hypothetical protein
LFDKSLKGSNLNVVTILNLERIIFKRFTLDEADSKLAGVRF